MTALEVLTMLRAAGVRLTPNVTTVHVDAPAGVLSEELRQAIRTHKAALLDLVEAFEERAAIAEYCGGVPRAEAERLAWARWPQYKPSVSPTSSSSRT